MHSDSLKTFKLFHIITHFLKGNRKYGNFVLHNPTVLWILSGVNAELHSVFYTPQKPKWRPIFSVQYLQSMSALLSPFGQCAEFLNTTVVQPILAPGMEIAVQYVQKLDENELKEKVGFQHLGRRGYSIWRS